ncbi:MAG: twin-arginine translocation signal domain-containing protein, partial [bacterium]
MDNQTILSQFVFNPKEDQMENPASKQNVGLPLTRREFLKTSTAATAGLMASSNFAFGFAASETIRIGLIGCGG